MSAIRIHTRRQFLNEGLGVVGAGAALPQFLVRSAQAGAKAGSDEPIVVSLLLTGGPDGLNVVPPHGHDAYFEKRKNLALPKKEILKLDDEVGLHPKLSGLKGLYDEGRMAVVLGTGYPNFNLSHFRSRKTWQAGKKGGSTGWLGRYVDHAFSDSRSPTLNVAVGPGRFPKVLKGKDHPGIGFASPDSFRYSVLSEEEQQALYQELNELSLEESKKKEMKFSEEDLQFVSQAAVNANKASERLRELAGAYQTPVTYPDTQFGHSVKTIAGLINGGLNTRAYFAAQGIAKFGGYDTHADQPGRLSDLLEELNGTVTAFYKDLARCGNDKRVLTFTFSEFGRRVPENYSGGTDHGVAQPMFLFGPGVKPGIHGKQPSLTDLYEAKGIQAGGGNLKMEVDFRRVYAAILENWLGVPAKAVLGKPYEPVGCVA